MANRTELLEALSGSLGETPGIAVLHSSFASLAPKQVLGKWDVLYAIDQLVAKGWSFAFPAFTFSFCKTGVFDSQNTSSEVGILADWVRESIPGAFRTEHPIYSFVVVGPLADEFASNISDTTFGVGSPFAFMEKVGACIVMLGAGWRYCTLFHRYEELACVGYRFYKNFSGVAVQRGKRDAISSKMYVRDLEVGAINDFSPLVDDLVKKDLIRTVPLWRGAIETAKVANIRDCAKALLEKDDLVFVKNATDVRYRLEMAEEASLTPAFRVALLGASNLEVAGNDLRDALADMMPGRNCEIHVPPFGQTALQIMTANSELDSFDPQIAIFADRLEDLVGLPALDLATHDVILDAVQDHIDIIRHFAKQNGGTIVVHRFALVGRHTSFKTAELAGIVQACNRMLDKALGDLDQLVWVDLAAEAASDGGVSDPRLWSIGRIPFSRSFTDRLVNRWSGIVLSILGKTARLIVMDLDNTLWGGVLGEDGPEGIALGGDHPGNAFSRFQKTLKSLSDHGIALAVSSKNDEDLALSTLNDHEKMVIRPDDLVTHRINWQPKWRSIQEIAEELDIGLGSILFIDDNPVERERVKTNLPMVKVLDLPQDPTAYADALMESPWTEMVQAGKEDMKRVASYKARRKINEERVAAASIDDFLHGLQMKLFMQPVNDSNIARAVQLCQKTNQFNTTTRRYTAKDLTTMRDGGSDVVVIGLEDKHTSRENIGLIVLQPSTEEAHAGQIDLFLMSCRVLGRTVERAVLEWAIGWAQTRGWGTLRGQIIETPRNTPARKVFEDQGFHSGPVNGQWAHPTRPAEIPDWFDLHDSYTGP